MSNVDYFPLPQEREWDNGDFVASVETADGQFSIYRRFDGVVRLTPEQAEFVLFHLQRYVDEKRNGLARNGASP